MSTTEKAKRLIELTNFREHQLSGFIAGLDNGLIGVEDPRVRETCIDYFKQNVLDELDRLSIEITTKHHSEEAIDALLAFYSTDIGRKIAKTQTTVSEETLKRGMQCILNHTQNIENALDKLDE